MHAFWGGGGRGHASARILVNRSSHVEFTKNLGAGERGREGVGGEVFSPLPSSPPPFSFSLIPNSLVALCTLSNLPLLLKSKMATTVELPLVTTSCRRSPLLRDHFSKTPKFPQSNHYSWNLS